MVALEAVAAATAACRVVARRMAEGLGGVFESPLTSRQRQAFGEAPRLKWEREVDFDRRQPTASGARGLRLVKQRYEGWLRL